MCLYRDDIFPLDWFHKLEVFINHIVELIFPYLVVFPRRVRILSGLAQIIFQVSRSYENIVTISTLDQIV
jgi:hypothetical protein